VVALNPYTLADVLADIERVGRAVGRSAVAARVVAELQARIDRVRQRTAELTVEQRPSVGCIEWIEPLMIAANWIPEMIELAGARQQLSIGGQHSTYTAWEALLAADPDVIVVAPCGFNLDRTLQEVRALQLRSEWSRLRAVQTGRVFACDGDALFNRSGPRLVDTLELLARLVHPERWGHRRDDPGESGVWQRLASAPLARRG
jgi:iron complex transport system substrate-binding protein